MNPQPKIYLVHALEISMAPVEAAFRAHWPEARLAHFLDNALFADFGAAGRLTDDMIERFRMIGRYCAFAQADAILFTCSAFGAAIEAVQREQRIPVHKPNEALYDAIGAQPGRVVLLATFGPTLPSMLAEIEAHARARGATPQVDTHLVEGALEALQAGRPEEHHRLIAEAAARFDTHAAIAFAQFSMAPARPLAEARARVPILTTPDTAVARLRAQMG